MEINIILSGTDLYSDIIEVRKHPVVIQFAGDYSGIELHRMEIGDDTFYKDHGFNCYPHKTSKNLLNEVADYRLFNSTPKHNVVPAFRAITFKARPCDFL